MAKLTFIFSSNCGHAGWLLDHKECHFETYWDAYLFSSLTPRKLNLQKWLSCNRFGSDMFKIYVICLNAISYIYIYIYGIMYK